MPGPASPAPAGGRLRLLLAGLLAGMLLAALDLTIVATSVRTIADQLGGYSMQAWVTTAYLITSTVCTPLYGRLADNYGRKRLYLLAILGFIGGSLLCSLAQSVPQLTVFRAIQGIGGGGLMSLALTIVGDVVAPRERARIQGYFLAAFGSAGLIGPVIGGLLAGQQTILGVDGWRWVFAVNVPIGLLAAVVVGLVLPGDRREFHGRIDFFGAFALAATIVPLLLVAEQGREWGWATPRSGACYVAGGIGLLLFLIVEARAGDDAVLPLGVFRSREFALGVAISTAVGAVMFGSIMLLPQYFQIIRGSSPALAGVQMLPMVLGMMIGSIVSGQRIGATGHYRRFPLIGTLLAAVGALLLSRVGTSTGLWYVVIAAFVLGVGLGCAVQPVALALQSVLPPARIGISTAAGSLFRQLGGTIGVTVCLTVLFSRLSANLAGLPRPPGSRSFHDVLDDSSALSSLPPALVDQVRHGFVDAFGISCLVVSAVAAVACVLVGCWREVPLRDEAAGSATEGAGREPDVMHAIADAGNR